MTRVAPLGLPRAVRAAIGAWIGQHGARLDADIADGTWPRPLVCRVIGAFDEPDRSQLGGMPIAIRGDPTLRVAAKAWTDGDGVALDINLGYAAGVYGFVRSFAALTAKRGSGDRTRTLDQAVRWARRELKWQASPALNPASSAFALSSNQRRFADDVAGAAMLFTIAHELGHVAAGDADPSMPRVTADVQRGREFEADRAGLQILLNLAADPEENFDLLFAGCWAVLSWAQLAEPYGLHDADHPPAAERKERLLELIENTGLPAAGTQLARAMEGMFSDLRPAITSEAPDARLATGQTRGERASAGVAAIASRYGEGDVSLAAASARLARRASADPGPVILALRALLGVQTDLALATAERLGPTVVAAVRGDAPVDWVMGTPWTCAAKA